MLSTLGSSSQGYVLLQGQFWSLMLFAEHSCPCHPKICRAWRWSPSVQPFSHIRGVWSAHFGLLTGILVCQNQSRGNTRGMFTLARWPSCCQDPFPLQTKDKNTAGSVTAAWEPNLIPPELGAGGDAGGATRHLQPRGQQEGRCTSTSLQEGFGPSWLTKTACKPLWVR